VTGNHTGRPREDDCRRPTPPVVRGGLAGAVRLCASRVWQRSLCRQGVRAREALALGSRFGWVLSAAVVAAPCRGTRGASVLSVLGQAERRPSGDGRVC